MAIAKFLPVLFIVLFMISSDINGVSGQLNCGRDNHIGRCLPGKDDEKCNTMCASNGCPNGGYCVVRAFAPPNHFCHCRDSSLI
ncbi:hypothetical protein ACP275_02G110300 [Erythranthe tilingii]